MAKKQGFKKVPWSLRDRLRELSGNELKVWLHAYLYSGKDDASTLDNPRIARETNLHLDTVKESKAVLRSNGWLIKTGEVFGSHGGCPMPTLQAVIPPQGVKKSTIEDGLKGGKTPPKHKRKISTQPMEENFHHIVDTLSGSGQKPSLPVDTKTVNDTSEAIRASEPSANADKTLTQEERHKGYCEWMKETWDALPVESKKGWKRYGEWLASELGQTSAWDVLDAFKIANNLFNVTEEPIAMQGMSSRILLQIYKENFKKARQTLEGILFRLQSPNVSGDGKSLYEQFIKAWEGHLRTEEVEVGSDSFESEVVDENDSPASRGGPFTMEVEDV